MEGQYWKQTRRLVNQLDKSTGRMHSYYEKGDPVMAYTIPFSKQNVDKYLLDPHPFGPDSENITDPNQVRILWQVFKRRSCYDIIKR